MRLLNLRPDHLAPHTGSRWIMPAIFKQIKQWESRHSEHQTNEKISSLSWYGPSPSSLNIIPTPGRKRWACNVPQKRCKSNQLSSTNWRKSAESSAKILLIAKILYKDHLSATNTHWASSKGKKKWNKTKWIWSRVHLICTNPCLCVAAAHPISGSEPSALLWIRSFDYSD